MVRTLVHLNDVRSQLIAWREAGESVALVPTMGALHRGHGRLIEAAQSVAKRTMVSIFVNPLQFGPKEDYRSYPRQPDEDCRKLDEYGCDAVYFPKVDEMYGSGNETRIHPGHLSDILEGVVRKGHFVGVATIVVKLLMQTMPDIAVFGEKDFQQLVIIRNTIRDLNIPVHILAVPTVRDLDGLALSSRNTFLSHEERKTAAELPKILFATAEKLASAEPVEATLLWSRQEFEKKGFVLSYLELCDSETLNKLKSIDFLNKEQKPRLFFAAYLGKTRLIDNVMIDRK